MGDTTVHSSVWLQAGVQNLGWRGTPGFYFQRTHLGPFCRTFSPFWREYENANKWFPSLALVIATHNVGVSWFVVASTKTARHRQRTWFCQTRVSRPEVIPRSAILKTVFRKSESNAFCFPGKHLRSTTFSVSQRMVHHSVNSWRHACENARIVSCVQILFHTSHCWPSSTPECSRGLLTQQLEL